MTSTTAPATHVITGATGFVGGALALELLQRTSDRLVCLVRGEDDAAATRRLHDALGHAAELYGVPDLLPSILERSRAVAGDMTDDALPEAADRFRDAADGTAPGTVWHVAASLKYEDRHAEEINLMNVTGTRNVLALAKALGRPVFNHVSTAYVAGKRTGLMREEFPGDTESANNVYEFTKTIGEQEVAASGLPWRVLRPSIVIGHGGTGAATSFTGMYGFVSSVLRFRRAVEKEFGNLLQHRQVPIIADPQIECDLVPVDLVARNAVAIGLEGALSTVYHLNNGGSPTVGEVIEEIFELTGLRTPRFVSNRGLLIAIDLKLDEGIQFYASYMINGKTFDQTNTESVCGEGSQRFPIDRAEIRRFVRWYLDRIEADGRSSAPARAAFAYQPARQEKAATHG
ncbi:SDR family oxidoreductase [Streptomyces sp. WMMC897]|uniref:SDR family oxidoreductase n=1 Tax=Streptomyces sp. WMMC897 TaxID=3014782 RepID=UPI0022B7176D|nr:SDR family oxidoreductase [Streptomyces sp. WMMC897]MCZ7417809.1 SDR family oxidoreductase [Streptomyces sp. WMMC897]